MDSSTATRNSEFFENTGIKYERSNVETLQINEIAERINRTLIDHLVKSMLKDAKLPQKFWAEVVVWPYTIYIYDRVEHSSIKGEVLLIIYR